MSEKSLRYNDGKLKFALIPAEMLEELAKIFTKGAFKYDDNNWMRSINSGLPSEEFRTGCMNSMLRHINAYRKGELHDPEPVDGCDIQTSHMGHAAWNCLVLFYYDAMEGSSSGS